MNPSRRRFVFAGLAGAAALAALSVMALRRPPAPPAAGRQALDADGVAIVTAVTPVLLANALPADAAARATAIAETVGGVDTAIAGLPPASRAELAQLFTLLALPPARVALARVDAPWSEATPAAVGAFLDRFRDSRVELLRSAYDALHQLVYAAWYGNPRSWAAIGYVGPPPFE